VIVGPSPEALWALRRDLEGFLASKPGSTPIQAARALQLRLPVMWAALAPLLEARTVEVRGQGLFLLADTPTR